jgi:vancomycin permeability regulator SanA
MRKGVKIMLITTVIVILAAGTMAALDQYVEYTGKQTIRTMEAVEPAEVILILGAYVHPSGEVSRMLKDRLDFGLELYQAGKAPKMIVSGDHGSKSYDEVRAMCEYLEAAGVPPEDIFMDHAGFNTYDSMYRMKAIFDVTDAIVVSQKYHVVRAAYIAEKLGIKVQSIASDTYVYEKIAIYRVREIGARIKAVWMAGIVKPNPTYLGEKIPITGSGMKTRD